MLQLVENTDDFCVVTSDQQMIFLVWKRNVVKEGLDLCTSTARTLMTINGDKKMFVLTTTLKGVSQPNDEALVNITEWLTHANDMFNASAVMHYDSGWRGALVKTVTWAIAKASNYTIPHRPFFSYRSAISWFVDDFPDAGLNKDVLIEDFETLLTAVMKEKAESNR